MKFRLYKNATGDWAWTLIARNGKKVANGGEGYKRFSAMARTLRAIFVGSQHQAALAYALEQHKLWTEVADRARGSAPGTHQA